MNHTEELRDDLRRVIDNYPHATVAETLGVLELVKAEMLDRLRRCQHPDAQRGPDTARPDL